MHFLSALLFLSAIMMGKAEDDISKDLDLESLSELLYFFEVISDAPVEDLKGSLRNVSDFRHSFKVIGEPTYYFAIMMGKAEDDISKDLDLESLSELLYFFEVISDAPVEDLKGSLRNVSDFRHSFKVIGEPTYYFVIHEDDVDKLRQLTFPPGSMVTQYLVEHISDFSEMFNLKHGMEEKDEEDAMDNVPLIMGNLDFLVSENTPTAVYSATMEQHIRKYIQTHAKTKHVFYSVLAAYPAKFLYFAQVEANAFQHLTLDGADPTGGPGNLRGTHQHVVRI